MKYFLIIFVNIIIVLNSNASDDFMDSFIYEISTTSVELHCNSEWFLENTGLTKTKCAKVLGRLTKDCNELIKPLIPSKIDDDSKGDGDIDKLRNIGELYSLCLVGYTFQEGFQKKE